MTHFKVSQAIKGLCWLAIPFVHTTVMSFHAPISSAALSHFFFLFPLHKQICLNSTVRPLGDERLRAQPPPYCPVSVTLANLEPSFTHPVFCLVSRAWRPGSASSGLFSSLHLAFSFTHTYFSGLLHPDHVLWPGRIYVVGLNLMKCWAGLFCRFPATEARIRNNSP